MRRLLPFLAVAAVFLFGGGSSAAPQRGIIVRGAASGSHLRLTVSGSQLLVSGQLAEVEPVGCRLTRGLSAATCGLEEAGSIVVEMGSSNDMVEVLDPLPVPLTAYLGGGSDKLIGNAEQDICFPQGSRRNRCYGSGGDDICVSGLENTDCIGGPGNDVCEMGAGLDGCHGEGGNDRLSGGDGADQLYGGAGKDYCDGGPGIGRSHECEVGPQR